MMLFLQNSWMGLVLTVIAAYLLGSLSFAIIVTRLLSHEDIRRYGSGNAGATNVLRSQGKRAAILTTIGDLGKSLAAVLLGGFLMTHIQLLDPDELYRLENSLTPSPLPDAEELRLIGQYLAGLFCIIGHLLPLYFGFRGGKGVLTTLGMMLILDWRVALICLGLFIVVVLIWKMVSLGSVCAAALLPIMTFVFRKFVDGTGAGTVWFCTGMSLLIAAILIGKHIPNLRRIAQGTESKFSFGHKADKANTPS